MVQDVVVERIDEPAVPRRQVRLPITIAKHGVSFGMALAMICSWHVNSSVPWAIVHGFLSWIYVLYYLIAY